jgi:hypothetical protein
MKALIVRLGGSLEAVPDDRSLVLGRLNCAEIAARVPDETASRIVALFDEFDPAG